MRYGMLWKSLRGRIYTAAVAFFAMVLTLYLAGETFTIYWEGEMVLKRNWSVFQGDPKHTYVMTLALDTGAMDIGTTIAGAYEEIEREVGLKRFGAYKLTGHFFDELKDTSTAFYEKNSAIWKDWNIRGDRGDLICCLDMYGNIDELFRFDLAEGNFPSLEESEGGIPILVSDGYRDAFAVGEKLHAQGREYRVSGYLEPDGYFPQDNAYGSSNQGGQEMEYLFVVRYEFPDPVSEDSTITNFYENTYLEFSDGKQQEQIGKIDDIMEKWGILYRLQSVEDSYGDALKKTTELYGTRLKYGGIFLVVNLFVGISISVVQSLRRRKEFGICQACGWTQREWNRLMLLELCVEKIFGLVLAGGWLLHKIAEWRTEHSMGKITEIYDMAFWQRTVPFLIAYLVIMSVVSYFVSISILKQKNCAELIRGK